VSGSASGANLHPCKSIAASMPDGLDVRSGMRVVLDVWPYCSAGRTARPLHPGVNCTTPGAVGSTGAVRPLSPDGRVTSEVYAGRPSEGAGALRGRTLAEAGALLNDAAAP
jgi:hypothetical protein